MRKIGHIFLREYLQSVRSKAFIIITILTPLIFGVIFGLPILVGTRGGQRYRVGVVETAAGGQPGASAPGAAGQPGAVRSELLPLLREHLERRTDSFRQSFQFQAVPFEPGREAEVRARLRGDVMAGRLDAYLWFDGDPTREGTVEYHGRSVTDMVGLRVLENGISRAVVQRRLVARGIAAGDVQELVKTTRLKTVRVSSSGEREDRGVSLIMAFFFLMVLYATLILYGVTVMRSVIEEKTSRIYEVLLSSVRPIELLAGKILGGAAVGMTQYAVWIFLALLTGGGLGLAAIRTEIGEFAVPGHILVFFALFFLLGFLLYSTMFAALGAMVNTEQEAQQLQILIMQFLIVPVLVAQLVIRSPNGAWATVLSLIPFFTPTLMFLRITVVAPPAWQVALSIVLLLATIGAVLWIAARIYRVGILMYGKRPTLPELLRWVRAA